MNRKLWLVKSLIKGGMEDRKVFEDRGLFDGYVNDVDEWWIMLDILKWR